MKDAVNVFQLVQEAALASADPFTNEHIFTRVRQALPERARRLMPDSYLRERICRYLARLRKDGLVRTVQAGTTQQSGIYRRGECLCGQPAVKRKASGPCCARCDAIEESLEWGHTGSGRVSSEVRAQRLEAMR